MSFHHRIGGLQDGALQPNGGAAGRPRFAVPCRSLRTVALADRCECPRPELCVLWPPDALPCVWFQKRKKAMAMVWIRMMMMAVMIIITMMKRRMSVCIGLVYVHL